MVEETVCTCSQECLCIFREDPGPTSLGYDILGAYNLLEELGNLVQGSYCPACDKVPANDCPADIHWWESPTVYAE